MPRDTVRHDTRFLYSTPLPYSALDLIRDHHRDIERQFTQLYQPGARVGWLTDQLCRHLERIFILEERHFYPQVLDCGGAAARGYVEEARDDQEVIRKRVAELRSVPPGSERWLETLALLEEDVRHAIDEEEANLFTVASGCMDGQELARLGDVMIADAEG